MRHDKKRLDSAGKNSTRDGARYRYLIASSPREEVCFLGVAYFGKEALDRAIDAAMAEQEAGGYTL